MGLPIYSGAIIDNMILHDKERQIKVYRRNAAAFHSQWQGEKSQINWPLVRFRRARHSGGASTTRSGRSSSPHATTAATTRREGLDSHVQTAHNILEAGAFAG